MEDTTQWSPFLTIIEHTKNILKPNKELIPSLLKAFDIFQLHLFDNKQDKEVNAVDIIAIRCSNSKK